MSPDPIEVALRISAILEGAGVEYLVGGSVAASLSGVPRSTMDVDMVVRLDEGKIEALVWLLGEGFYVDREALVRAVRERSSANLIHLESGMKIDLFVLRDHAVDQEQMRRRRKVRVAVDPDRFLFVYQPEDIVLQKLRWYRLGNESSDRQWGDVLSVLRVTGEHIDRPYLVAAAERMDLSELLERALAQADGR